MKGCNDVVSLINASLDIVSGISYLGDASLTHVSRTTEYTELQPLLSGVHSVMRVKLALAGEGLITFTITSKVVVYAPAEWADTLTLFHLL